MDTIEKTSSKKWMKRGLWSTLGLAAILGTYQSHDHDCPPIYTNHTGNSYGLSLGAVQNIQERATHYGSRISLANGGEGTINGLELGFFNIHSPISEEETERNERKEIGYENKEGKVNGVQLSFVNIINEMNGLRLGLVNGGNQVNGLDIGLVNYASQGSHVQIGLMNFSDRNADYWQIGLVNIVHSEEDPEYLSSSILINWNSNNKKTSPSEKDK